MTKKLNRFSVSMILVATIGFVLSIVGLVLPWFTIRNEMRSYGYGLFENFLKTEFPIEVLQSFAIVTLILAVAACIVFVLCSLGIIKIKRIYRIVYAVVVILFALLTFNFTIVVLKDYYAHYVGIPLMGEPQPNIGAFLLSFGAMITTIPLFCNKKSSNDKNKQ